MIAAYFSSAFLIFPPPPAASLSGPHMFLFQILVFCLSSFPSLFCFLSRFLSFNRNKIFLSLSLTYLSFFLQCFSKYFPKSDPTLSDRKDTKKHRGFPCRRALLNIQVKIRKKEQDIVKHDNNFESQMPRS